MRTCKPKRTHLLTALVMATTFACTMLADSGPGFAQSAGSDIEQPHADLLASFAQAAPDEYASRDYALNEQIDDNDWGDDPFAQGNKFWAIRGGYSRDSELGEIYHVQAAAGRYFKDDLAYYLGASIGYADTTDEDDGVYGGPHIGIRWHFLTEEKWSLYLDASAGAVFHQHPLTEESLHFNFDVQGGIGGTWKIKDDLLLDAGVRWHHLSNARIKGKDQNLGYDGPMGYVGVVIPF